MDVGAAPKRHGMGHMDGPHVSHNMCASVWPHLTHVLPSAGFLDPVCKTGTHVVPAMQEGVCLKGRWYSFNLEVFYYYCV